MLKGHRVSALFFNLLSQVFEFSSVKKKLLCSWWTIKLDARLIHSLIHFLKTISQMRNNLWITGWHQLLHGIPLFIHRPLFNRLTYRRTVPNHLCPLPPPSHTDTYTAHTHTRLVAETPKSFIICHSLQVIDTTQATTNCLGRMKIETPCGHHATSKCILGSLPKPSS
jgi:hypothetical protein